ncbi:hypothetical protein SLV14_006813 [Streptomyces sp. Je 1-4]|uniref:hypothetical protein n=1 Tax=Streptomyces TaxID=1883 RepID=UPI0021D8174E|nr:MULTISPECIES: hypothetical protein [unclassified Streptomyces]UYB43796.1 hypothetical protein SLV14_006813 [Streptomyces sp. Je 1-4]UZQ40206.1 hypothetical protein SLV14N_006813 [Streptomyces sp. Je 1-4] [Streptomyces sp. Je 1-4 4N24]UZQ47623.1 hypothetical protein SLV14NA_006813 [Streptomyces sp. Je 1-4] [Streptomyces sp. Je 1-4 4N24_ara]
MAGVRQLPGDLPVFAGELPAPSTAPDAPVAPFTARLVGAARAQVPEPRAMTKELRWP